MKMIHKQKNHFMDQICGHLQVNCWCASYPLEFDQIMKVEIEEKVRHYILTLSSSNIL